MKRIHVGIGFVGTLGRCPRFTWVQVYVVYVVYVGTLVQVYVGTGLRFTVEDGDWVTLRGC